MQTSATNGAAGLHSSYDQTRKIRYDWDSLAARDAFWAILTDGSKAGGKWDVAEFMATGDTEVETVMDHLARIGCIPDIDGAALDFGCGVGRLTQPLAQYFASCVGVDISKQMIQRAESLNRYSHCRYMTISDTRLPFADASFLFIYSNIVLQHMPQRLSKEYLREFIRVLAAGGVLVFGVQDSFAVGRFLSIVSSAPGAPHSFQDQRCTGSRLAGYADALHAGTRIRRTLGSAKLLDIQLTNTAAKDFNGRVKYLREAPASGYIGKQYCVVKVP